jgi:hypothetical protein
MSLAVHERPQAQPDEDEELLEECATLLSPFPKHLLQRGVAFISLVPSQITNSARSLAATKSQPPHQALLSEASHSSHVGGGPECSRGGRKACSFPEYSGGPTFETSSSCMCGSRCHPLTEVLPKMWSNFGMPRKEADAPSWAKSFNQRLFLHDDVGGACHIGQRSLGA